MARDLGTGRSEVHRAAGEVLAFWLDETPPEKRFAKDAALDAEIARRFGALRDRVAADASAWRDDPETLLAAVILLDQFSRNIHRGGAEAYAADPIARDLARQAIDAGWDRDMASVRRAFLYMPFQHSESREDQALSLALFGDLGDEQGIRYARLHAEQIERFGRFPQRNEPLGRVTTPEEADFLSRPDARF